MNLQKLFTRKARARARIVTETESGKPVILSVTVEGVAPDAPELPETVAALGKAVKAITAVQSVSKLKRDGADGAISEVAETSRELADMAQRIADATEGTGIALPAPTAAIEA